MIKCKICHTEFKPKPNEKCCSTVCKKRNKTNSVLAYQRRNPEKRRLIESAYHKRNSERYKANARRWNRANREKENARMTMRYYTDLKTNISNRMAKGIRRALHGKGGVSWTTIVGYTIDQLKDRLKLTMPKGATWADFLAGRLHIDHIRPKALFEYKSQHDPDFKRCWSLNNLQLLWAEDNLAKGAKI